MMTYNFYVNIYNVHEQNTSDKVDLGFFFCKIRKHKHIVFVCLKSYKNTWCRDTLNSTMIGALEFSTGLTD